MSTHKGFGPQRPTTTSSVEVYTPPAKPRRIIHRVKRDVVDSTPYVALPRTEAEQKLFDERIITLGIDENHQALWAKDYSEFGCLGTERMISRLDLLYYVRDDIERIHTECTRRSSAMTEEIKDLTTALTAATPEMAEHLQKAIRCRGKKKDALDRFAYSCRDIAKCTRESFRIAQENNELDVISRVRNENKLLLEKVAKLKSKLASVSSASITIPELPAPSTEPRSLSDLIRMYDTIGDEVYGQWSVDEHSIFVDGCHASASHLRDASADKSYEEFLLEQQFREVALDRLADARFALQEAEDEYDRLFKPESQPAALNHAVDDDDDGEDHEARVITAEQREVFDANYRQRIRHQVETFLAKQQKEENHVNVRSSHIALKACFDAEAEQGEWTYLPDDHDMCKTGQQTRFSDQLSHVLTRMAEEGVIKRIGKYKQTFTVLRLL